ncbi:hypothetical protein ACFWXO_13575 [Kitasatospora sp. NPDC059088]|uniref:hypothetical protein n=1 Tax=Kitasatospora sp. NPDC059088 TaxID=3346722 RepID=UPI003698BFDE
MSTRPKTPPTEHLEDTVLIPDRLPAVVVALLLVAAAVLGWRLAAKASSRPPVASLRSDRAAHCAVAAPPRPTAPPVPPAWYRLAWTDTQQDLMAGRTAAARQRAGRLVVASTHVFGADHIYTRWSWDQYTATAAAPAAEPPAQWVGEPLDEFETVLIPEAFRDGHRRQALPAGRA